MSGDSAVLLVCVFGAGLLFGLALERNELEAERSTMAREAEAAKVVVRAAQDAVRKGCFMGWRAL